MKVTFPLLSLKNESFFHFGLSAVQMVLKRISCCLRRKWIDVPSDHTDKIFQIPELSDSESRKNYIEWSLPHMSFGVSMKLVKDQINILKL